MATIPFLVGKTSDDILVRQDLAGMQHLFISYSENEQYHRLLADAIKDLHRQREELYFATAVTTDCYKHLDMFHDPVARHFTNNSEHTASKQAFMRSLLTVLRHRQKHNFSGAGAPAILILIEDVFEMIIPDKKGIGNHFLQLLLQGPSYNMHMIIGSIRTYRNLLTQLIHLDLHPKLRKQFGDAFTKDEALGAELILNADDLVFYKSRKEADYRRYFYSREGEERMMNKEHGISNFEVL